MSVADQDCYFAQSGEIARLLDADPVPRTRAAAEQLIRDFRAELRADERTREFRDLVLNAPARSIRELPVQQLLMNAAGGIRPDARFRAWHARLVASGPAAAGARDDVRRRGMIRLGFRRRDYRPRTA